MNNIVIARARTSGKFCVSIVEREWRGVKKADKELQIKLSTCYICYLIPFGLSICYSALSPPLSYGALCYYLPAAFGGTFVLAL